MGSFLSSEGQESRDRNRELGRTVLHAEEIRRDGKFKGADALALDVMNAAVDVDGSRVSVDRVLSMKPGTLLSLAPEESRPAASRAGAVLAGSLKFHGEHLRSFRLLSRALRLSPGNRSAFFQIHAIASFNPNRDLTAAIPDTQTRRAEITRELGIILTTGKTLLERLTPGILSAAPRAIVLNGHLQSRNSEDAENLLWIIARVGLRHGRGVLSDTPRSHTGFAAIDTAAVAATRILNIYGVTTEQDPHRVLSTVKFADLIKTVEGGSRQCLDAVRVVAAAHQLRGILDGEATYGFSLLANCEPWDPGFAKVGQSKLVELHKRHQLQPSRVLGWEEFQEALMGRTNAGGIGVPDGFIRHFQIETENLSAGLVNSIVTEMGDSAFKWERLISAMNVGFTTDASKVFFEDTSKQCDEIERRVHSGSATTEDVVALLAIRSTPRSHAVGVDDLRHNDVASAYSRRAEHYLDELKKQRRKFGDQTTMAEALDNLEIIAHSFDAFTGTIINECAKRAKSFKKGETALIMPGYAPLVNRGPNKYLESRWLARSLK